MNDFNALHLACLHDRPLLAGCRRQQLPPLSSGTRANHGVNQRPSRDSLLPERTRLFPVQSRYVLAQPIFGDIDHD